MTLPRKVYKNKLWNNEISTKNFELYTPTFSSVLTCLVFKIPVIGKKTSQRMFNYYKPFLITMRGFFRLGLTLSFPDFLTYSTVILDV